MFVAGDFLTRANTLGIRKRVNNADTSMPPITARASGTMASLPGNNEKANGERDAIRVSEVIRIGLTRIRAAV